MLEYGWARPEEEQDLLDFANYVFSLADGSTDFTKLQPKVYSRPGFSVITARAMEDGRVRGMISILPQTLRLLPGINLQYGYIGTVAVHPYQRGRGHMKALMPLVMDRMRKEGRHFVALSGQRQRYQHYGFENAGEQLVLRFSSASLRHALGKDAGQGITFTKLSQAGDEALQLALGLHDNMHLATQRKPEDFLLILQTNQGEGWAILQEGKPIGYLCHAAHWISEICLTNPQLAGKVMASWLHKNGGQLVNLIARPFDLIDHQALYEAVDDCYAPDSCMIQVLDWAAFLEGLLRLKQALIPLAVGEKVLGIEGAGNYLIQVQTKAVRVTASDKTADKTISPQAAVRLTTLPHAAWLFSGHPFFNWFPLPFHILSADHF